MIRHYLHCKFRQIILLAVSLLSTPTGSEINYFRRAKSFLLRLLGVLVGENLEIQSGLFAYNGKRLQVGSNCVIGANTQIWDYSKIKIGDNFLGSKNLTLISGTHNTADYSSMPGPISLGDRIWVGINVTICGPVTIGNDVIIGAGAVVLNSFPDGVIIGGIPAKILSKR
jgi:acetyltransferase-like isoleucine patch superfamily enzyme